MSQELTPAGPTAPKPSQSSPRASGLPFVAAKLGRGGFWLLCILVALVSIPRFVPDVARMMPHTLVHFEARPFFFVPHVIAAGIALFILPFQASKKLREGRPKLHRWMGRVYVIACVIGGISGLGLALAGTTSTANLGFGMLAVVWVLSTLLAWRAARRRAFAAHRRWMIRSAALTFAAVTLRLYLPFGFIAGMNQSEIYTVVAWACWVPNLLIAEWFILPNTRSEPTAAAA